ncbi:MAG TPA: BadF/BadG/BcrA/BcrD ATPase family protein [Gaiella sp.]|jgi:N-acetylglucosamine kinase-like BadF-type ATPase|nr:BadF/BadG/BcrA/BcrD ATPase family protein [Gaiella sp.]
MSERIVLAVDGGNSKTDLALVRADGSLLAHVRGPLSSPHHLGLPESVGLLQRLLGEAVGVAGANGRVRPAVAQVFLAGVDFPSEEESLRAALEEKRVAGHVVVGNDTIALLRAGTERGWGVAVVCGAGINCVGVAPDGRQVRFPALGEITGDWGGGYDVGSAALFAAARAEDGRGAHTSLEQAVPRHFGLDSPRQVAEEMHAGRISHRRLIELAPVVFAEAGTDAEAAAIVRRLADEVVALARVALTRLGLERQPVEVVLGGGLLRAGDARLQSAIVAGLAEVGDQIVVHTTDAPPVVGAALLGLDWLDADDAAKERARVELTAAADADDDLEPTRPVGMEARRG